MVSTSHHPGANAVRAALAIALVAVTVGGLSATAAYVWHVYRLVVLNG